MQKKLWERRGERERGGGGKEVSVRERERERERSEREGIREIKTIESSQVEPCLMDWNEL